MHNRWPLTPHYLVFGQWKTSALVDKIVWTSSILVTTYMTVLICLLQWLGQHGRYPPAIGMIVIAAHLFFSLTITFSTHIVECSGILYSVPISITIVLIVAIVILYIFVLDLLLVIVVMSIVICISLTFLTLWAPTYTFVLNIILGSLWMIGQGTTIACMLCMLLYL